jgi:hypothetical protein
MAIRRRTYEAEMKTEGAAMGASRGEKSAAMTAPAREYSATITRMTILINALPSELASGHIASAFTRRQRRLREFIELKP